MRKMGLRTIYPKPRTSQPGKGHKIYPYLLRGLSIERSNQVWASDICYIPMAKGFMSLAVIKDWHSRRVLAWGLVSDLIKLSILKPATHVRYRVEEMAAFLGDYPPISPVPYEKGRWDINILSQV